MHINYKIRTEKGLTFREQNNKTRAKNNKWGFILCFRTTRKCLKGKKKKKKRTAKPKTQEQYVLTKNSQRTLVLLDNITIT